MAYFKTLFKMLFGVEMHASQAKAIISLDITFLFHLFRCDRRASVTVYLKALVRYPFR